MKKKVLLIAALLCTAMAVTGCGAKTEGKDISTLEKDYNLDEVVTLGDYAGLEKKAVGDTVKDGDTVNIDYEGKKDGVAFEGGTGNYDLTIGSNSFIPGFEEGLIGAKVGETLDLDLTFPEEYGNSELAGQAVVFTVTVNKILEDEDAVWKVAIDNATVKEYPESEMNSTYEKIETFYQQMAEYYQVEYSEFLKELQTSEETLRDDVKEIAEEQVKDKLVSLAIAKAEKLSLSEEEYTQKLDEYVKNYGYDSVDSLKEAVSEQDLTEQMLMEKARQFVLDNAVAK